MVAASYVLTSIALGFIWIKTQKDGLEGLRMRLHHYAAMKEGHSATKKEDSRCNLPAPTNGALHPKEHAILLGILKKVEAKNAALMRMWTFISAALLSIIFVERGELEWLAMFLCGLLLLCLPFLVATLVGVRQIDQIDFWRLTNAGLRDEALCTRMQEALMQDVLCKESLFRFALLGAFTLIPLGLIVLVVWRVVTLL
jgi:hypothetical protein